MNEDDKKGLLDLGKIEAKMAENQTAFTEAVSKMMVEADATKSVSEATKAEVEGLQTKFVELVAQFSEYEKHLTGGLKSADAPDTLGQMFTKSAAFESLSKSGAMTARQEFEGMSLKTAIINATGAQQPLVAAHRLPGIYAGPDRLLTVRDLLPSGVTSSNLVEFAKENVFTNNAAGQVGGSPEAFENVTKAESALTFTLASEAVRTIAHFIPASKQVLSDAPMLQSYIDSRMMYGLKLKEETQLLNGTGTNAELNGLITQATAYTTRSPLITNELDLIRDAMRQAAASEYAPTAIVLNHDDWFDIDTKKVASDGSDERYVVGNPRNMSQPNLWGLPVVVTNSIASGQFLVGAFAYGAQIWDRETASIEISRENNDNFVKNMVTILAEERIALTVYRPAAFIKGSL